MSVRKGSDIIAGLMPVVDSSPTASSTNPVSSGGVYDALLAKANDNDVVHLAGAETITGDKTFTQTVTTTPTSGNYINGFNTIHADLLNNYTNPTVTKGFQIGCLASDNSYIGWYSVSKATNGSTSAGVNVRRRDSAADSNHSASVGVVIDSNNDAWGVAPPSDVNNSIVTTVNKAKGSGTGYFEFGNGMIIQWGQISANSSGTTVTLPTAFSSTSAYRVCVTRGADTAGETAAVNINAASSFKVTTNNSSSRSWMWIAIGY